MFSQEFGSTPFALPEMGTASQRESNALLLEARFEYLDAKYQRVQSEIAELQVSTDKRKRKTMQRAHAHESIQGHKKACKIASSPTPTAYKHACT